MKKTSKRGKLKIKGDLTGSKGMSSKLGGGKKKI